MSLVATHIRFAIDLKDKYNVRDAGRYVAGSVYPDSRYLTGIKREVTHPNHFLISGFFRTDDDFRKGWFAHLLCDRLQSDITREKLPEIFVGPTEYGNETWIGRTALKFVQDMDDVSKFDIEQYISYVSNIENPCGEDMATLTKYIEIFKSAYTDPIHFSLEGRRRNLVLLGVDKELALKVKTRAEQYAADERIMNLAREIYPAALDRAKQL